jgi:hypothetical protein
VNFVGDPTSLTESTDLTFNVYPNPSIGSFVIEHNFESQVLEIFTMDGRLVYMEELDNFKSNVSTDLARGIYLLKLTDKVKNKSSNLLLELN